MPDVPSAVLGTPRADDIGRGVMETLYRPCQHILIPDSEANPFGVAFLVVWRQPGYPKLQLELRHFRHPDSTTELNQVCGHDKGRRCELETAMIDAKSRVDRPVLVQWRPLHRYFQQRQVLIARSY